jgi:type IV secretory pathway ATPase VirB11/archaellum biosynthesis ATPase
MRLVSRKERRAHQQPLLCELLTLERGDEVSRYSVFPFTYSVAVSEGVPLYSIELSIQEAGLSVLREAVSFASSNLQPESVRPLTFGRLVEVLSQLGARALAGEFEGDALKKLSALVAYESIGLSRVMALAQDRSVNEFYADSDGTPLYLDHSRHGRCETRIVLTEREVRAIETHMDTFRGYTLDYTSPSLKNDIELAGARLRVSVDKEPLAVNRFALDVRRLDVASMSLSELVSMNVLSAEAASFLVGWLELGGNVTIVGETGTGKTTLLNALDERLSPRLRRVYIEDAVETRDLLDRGYHQLKVKVDPFDRAEQYSRTKGTEIVKVLHRSPDIVILSEIQSEEHSRAFFHSLSSGARGIQTFHASSIEQAVRRWVNVHQVPKQCILDLGVMVQMSRPVRLGPMRFVTRICQVVSEGGEPRIRELYARDRQGVLQRVCQWERVVPPEGRSWEEVRSILLGGKAEPF